MTENKHTIVNIPNLISFARICMVPFIVWYLLLDELVLAFYLFSIAGISDFIDGWLARFQKIQTVFGAYLDPVADKLLMTSAYVTLTILGHIPIWLTLLVIFRDVLIVSMIAIARMKHKKVHMAPLFISKFNTLIQIVVVMLVLAHLAFGLGIETWLYYLFLLAGATTIISSFAYLNLWATTILKQKANHEG
ncbi:MAG: CDP-alcohol phosphatidyltransferase family protein [Hyphomicrobiales bacterium]